MVDELVILDFETTGLSPDYARVIEVGAIVLKDDIVVDTFSELMYPGSSIPHFITTITGITNQMVKGKPSPEKIMPKLKKFIGNRLIMCHNATFDQKFLISEMENIGEIIRNPFLCTLKLTRRLLPHAPDYKLTTLASYLKIKHAKDHQAHRALDDVMTTLQVWLHLKQVVTEHIKSAPTFDLLHKISQYPKSNSMKILQKHMSS